MTMMTPTNDTTLAANAAPTPAAAMSAPARAGPTARAKLNSMPLRADAAGSSALLTSSGSTARQVGVSMASPAASANVSVSRSHGDITPAIVMMVKTTATTTIQASVYRISFRRGRISPYAPAGSARRKNGNVDAVCVSATKVGPAPSETMSHAAPTLCMNAPMSETTSAIRRRLKIGLRRGLHRLVSRTTTGRQGQIEYVGVGPLITGG